MDRPPSISRLVFGYIYRNVLRRQLWRIFSVSEGILSACVHLLLQDIRKLLNDSPVLLRRRGLPSPSVAFRDHPSWAVSTCHTNAVRRHPFYYYIHIMPSGQREAVEQMAQQRVEGQSMSRLISGTHTSCISVLCILWLPTSLPDCIRLSSKCIFPGVKY